METILTQASLVGQLFVHGDSSEDKLVAVVVPDEDVVAVWRRAGESSSQGTSDEDLGSAVLAQMKDIGRQNGLKGYELVYAGDTLHKVNYNSVRVRVTSLLCFHFYLSVKITTRNS